MTGEKHLYCVARGDYVSSTLATERWQCGIRLWADVSVPDPFGNLPSTGDFSLAADTGTDTLGPWFSEWKWTVGIGTVIVPSDYLINQAAPAWKAFIQAGQFSNQVRLKEVRLYPIDSTGHAFSGASAALTYTTPPVGASTGDMLPPETSCVISWTTGRPGKRGRGRIYPPANTETATDSNGFATTSFVSNQISRASDLITALRVDPVSPTATHVTPAIIGDPWTQYAKITGCRVGNVFDTQRRRRRQLVEAYTPLAIP